MHVQVCHYIEAPILILLSGVTAFMFYEIDGAAAPTGLRAFFPFSSPGLQLCGFYLWIYI